MPPMRVRRLRRAAFATSREVELGLGDGITLVAGPNGAGKTNLLEALYFGAHRRVVADPRRARADRLRRADLARVEVEVGEGGRPPRPDRARAARRGQEPPCRRQPRQRRGRARARGRRSVCSLPDRLELVKGPPAVRRAHLDQLVARAVARARGGAPALRPGAGAAKRAAVAGPRRSRVAGVARRLGLRARRGGHRADRRARATRSTCSPRGSPSSAAALGLEGESRAALRAAQRRRERRRARRRAARAPRLRRPARAHDPRARTSTSSRSRSTTAPCGATARRASSARRCSRCCSASARRCSRSRGAAPLMLLDDVMSELDAERRELLDGAARERRRPGADHRDGAGPAPASRAPRAEVRVQRGNGRHALALAA